MVCSWASSVSSHGRPSVQASLWPSACPDLLFCRHHVGSSRIRAHPHSPILITSNVVTFRGPEGRGFNIRVGGCCSAQQHLLFFVFWPPSVGTQSPVEAFVDVSARVALAAGGVLPAPLPSVCPRFSARSFVSCFVPGLKATGAKQGSRGCYGR